MLRAARAECVLGQPFLLLFLSTESCNLFPLNLDLRIVGNLQRHGVLAQISDGSPDPGSRNDFVAFLQGLQQLLLLFLSFLLWENEQEIKNDEDQDEWNQRDQRPHSSPDSPTSCRSLGPCQGLHYHISILSSPLDHYCLVRDGRLPLLLSLAADRVPSAYEPGRTRLEMHRTFPVQPRRGGGA